MTIALDLDGTLVSCEPRQSAVLRAALAACGQRADVDLIWSLKREGASTLSALGRCGLRSNEANRVAELWQHLVEQPYWLGLDTVLPGVRETLSTWCFQGVTLVLLTARSRPEWLRQQLHHLGLAKFFNQVNCVPPGSAAPSKADLLRQLHPLAFVGDTESDAKAANDAKVTFLATASGQRSANFLKLAGVNSVSDGMSAVATLLRSC